jgi:hypothetical protein
MHPNRGRETFAQMCVRLRVESGRTAWARALRASRLRHVAKYQRQYCGARTLARIKSESIARAQELAPTMICITIDHEYQIGLPSIRWRGRDGARLHLPHSRLTARLMSESRDAPEVSERALHPNRKTAY